MKLIRMATLVGLVTAVPLCAAIYLSVSSLENAARSSKELWQMIGTITPDEAAMDEALKMPGLPEIAGLDDAPPERGSPLPVMRRIENRHRQPLDVVVTGRGEEALHFLSLKDNRIYRYPIAELSEEDRAFSVTLPVRPEQGGRYPVPWQLRDRTGRSLVAMVEGRSDREVFFRTLPGGDRHAYPIRRLSPMDREWVSGLPVPPRKPGDDRSGNRPGGSRLGPSKSLETAVPLTIPRLGERGKPGKRNR